MAGQNLEKSMLWRMSPLLPHPIAAAVGIMNNEAQITVVLALDKQRKVLESKKDQNLPVFLARGGRKGNKWPIDSSFMILIDRYQFTSRENSISHKQLNANKHRRLLLRTERCLLPFETEKQEEMLEVTDAAGTKDLSKREKWVMEVLDKAAHLNCCNASA